MAFWYIPLLRERDPLDTIFDDVFDWTFPSAHRRVMYHPYYDPRSRALLQRSASQQQGGTDDKADDDNFRVSLDVRHYNPDEINLKVDGSQLLVTGKHYRESDYGFERSEFQRSYPIPKDVDPKGFTSRISDNGFLEIEAPKIKAEAIKQAEQDVQQDETKFKAVFDVSNYKPDEVQVKVQGNEIHIRGEHKSESKDGEESFSHHRQFSRRLLLPNTVKVDSLQSKWTKEGKLILEADKLPAIASEERQLTIEHEADQGKMEE